jgi:hypothetical protein
MKHVLLLCTLALLGACVAPQPRTDFDPKADFTSLHSFAWLAEDPLFQPRDSDNAVSLLNRRRIVESIESTLVARGFVKAASRDSADFTLSYTIGTRDRLWVSSYPDRYGHGWGWGWPGYGRDMDVRSYTEGRLAIDVLDGRSHQPIWHGVSSGELSVTDLELSGERIPRAIAAILAQFPPR